MSDQERNEEWRTIPGYEDYEASNLGRIRSKDRYVVCSDGVRKFCKGKIRKSRFDQHGYIHTQVVSNGERKILKNHRAVAMAFIPNPTNKPCVNHIDNNPANNRVENLEWVTMKENSQWMLKQGRADRTQQWIDRLNAGLEKMRKPVIGTNLKTGETIRFGGVNETRAAGFEPSCVSVCCNNERRSHKGYEWRFEVNV